MKWSDEQNIVIEGSLTLEPGQHMMVCASAGSGKTTTLFGIAEKLLTDKVGLLLSFNQDIRKENIVKAKDLGIYYDPTTKHKWKGQLSVMTFHGLGLSYFKNKYKITPNKVWALCQKKLPSKLASKMYWALTRLRGHGFIGTTEADLKDQLINYLDPEWKQQVKHLWSMLKELSKDTKNIDFDDMCLLPVQYEWMRKKVPYDVILIDEVQDLNPSQCEMIHQIKLANPNINIIAVGDTKQAIYGFRGSVDSFNKVNKILGNCSVYELNTTFRCPSKIVRFVNRQVEESQMTAHRKGGQVIKVYSDQDNVLGTGEIVLHKAQMVVASRNSTLLSVWINLFLEDVPASLKGSGVCGAVRSMLKELPWAWRDLVSTLKDQARSSRNSGKIDQHSDCAIGLLEIIRRMKCRSKDDLYNVLDRMEQRSENAIGLETIHSVKGREAPVVAFISDHSWVREQRDNWRYVGMTRALEKLIMIKP